VRAKNKAGSWSQWSEASEAAVTGLPAEVISQVSNYPNPFDTRKGGEEGKTHITYILNQDADVTITLYDLLGYKVMEMVFGKGQPGGKQGPNDAEWQGKNELGDFVARGGYIAHIKAVGASGTKIAIRKIGVIH
jgi:flagellar hook assembly protein FlgD